MSFGMKIGTKLLQCGMAVLFLSGLNPTTAQRRAPQRGAAAGQERIMKAIQDLGTQIKKLSERVKRLESGQGRGSTRATRARETRRNTKQGVRRQGDTRQRDARTRRAEARRKQAESQKIRVKRRAEQAKKRAAQRRARPQRSVGTKRYPKLQVPLRRRPNPGVLGTLIGAGNKRAQALKKLLGKEAAARKKAAAMRKKSSKKARAKKKPRGKKKAYAKKKAVAKKAYAKKRAIAKKQAIAKKKYSISKRAKGGIFMPLRAKQLKGKAPLRVYERRQTRGKKAPSLGSGGILCPECIKRIRQLHQSHGKGVGKLPAVMRKLGDQGLRAFSQSFLRLPATQVIELELPSISSKVFELKLPPIRVRSKKVKNKMLQFLRIKAPSKKRSKAIRKLKYRKFV